MTNVISGWVNVRYCKDPKSLLCSFSSTQGVPSEVMSTFAYIGVLDGFKFANDALCRRFARYCCWFKCKPWVHLFTWIPKKYFNSPIFWVANSAPILSTTCCTNNSFKLVMTISSTYTNINTMCTSHRIYKEGYDFLLVNPMDIKSVSRQRNHILRDCLRPYNDFFNRHTNSGCSASTYLRGCDITILSSNFHWERHCRCWVGSSSIYWWPLF